MLNRRHSNRIRCCKAFLPSACRPLSALFSMCFIILCPHLCSPLHPPSLLLLIQSEWSSLKWNTDVHTLRLFPLHTTFQLLSFLLPNVSFPQVSFFTDIFSHIHPPGLSTTSIPHPLSLSGPLFFIPHPSRACQSPFFNNSLINGLIICNSFSSVLSPHPCQSLSQSPWLTMWLIKLTGDKIPNIFPFSIFTSITFPTPSVSHFHPLPFLIFFSLLVSQLLYSITHFLIFLSYQQNRLTYNRGFSSFSFWLFCIPLYLTLRAVNLISH